MVALFFLLFIGLELKHYIADYFLQPGWMLGGKGDFRQPGGYAHAGVHVDTQPRRFWSLHGLDQITHQLTYAAIIYAVLLSKGLV